MILDYNGIFPRIDEKTFIAENATVVGDVVIGCESSVWFGAVVRGEAPVVIGNCCNIQDNAVLHCDFDYRLVLGNGVTVGHSAIVHGCEIGENTVVGMGAIVMNTAAVGKNCIIGAGAVVPEGMVIPDGSVAVGCPARVVKEVDAERIEHNRLNAKAYTVLAGEYGKWKK